MDDQQARSMENTTSAAQVPRWPATTGAVGNISLFHHHDRIVLADFERVRYEFTAWGSERSSDLATSSDWSTCRHRGGQRNHLDRVC